MNESKIAASNIIWRFLERFGAQGVTLIVSVVLARLLDPEVYGTIALVTVITSILQVFVDSGLSSALIQKKDADDIDFSTVFFFNLVICVALYSMLFLFSPVISDFYKIPELTPVIRILGLTIIVSGVKGVQQAYVSRHLLFKRFFFATLGGTVGAAIIGVWMAYSGYGVWALVVQYLFNTVVDTVILWVTVKWRPILAFSFSRLGKLFSFGWKIFLASILATVTKELRQLIIGKKYSSEDLAFYNKGSQFPDQGTQAINNAIDSVLLPVMSNAQNDVSLVKKMTRKSIKTSSFCIWPMMAGLFACSSPLIGLLLTEKWLPCVPYLQIFCITYAFIPIQTANLNAIKALGYSKYILMLQVIKDVISITVTLITMMFGVYWMALGCIITSIASQLINSWPNRKLLDYKYYEQLFDILPIALLSIVMALIVWSINLLSLPNWLTLLIQIPLGVVVYVGCSWILKFETLTYCLEIMKGLFSNKKKVK